MIPRNSRRQRSSETSFTISPTPTLQSTRTDYYGNEVCVFSLQALHTELAVTAKSVVETSPREEFDLALSPEYDVVRKQFLDPVAPTLCEPYQYVFDSPHVPCRADYADYGKQSLGKDTPLLVGVRDLTRRINQDFKFDPAATTVATPLEEVWSKRRGVCQDFAHLSIGILRSLGIPARYVSGYLRTVPPPGQKRLVGADQSHAWFSVYCPQRRLGGSRSHQQLRRR